MTTSFVEYASMHLFFIHAAEAAVLLAVVGYSWSRLRRGLWAPLSAAGGLVAGVSALVLAVGWAQVEFAESLSLFNSLAEDAWVGKVMDWSRPAGLLLIGVALWRASNRSFREGPEQQV